jgi:Tfp pilus assembly protein PilV
MKIRIPKSKPELQRGFSLMEVILIIVILGLVTFPLTRLAKVNLRNLADYSIKEKAQYDIQSVMEQVIADFRKSATGYDDTKTKWNGKIGTTNSGKFSYGVTISADQVQNGVTYAEVTVTVSGGGLTPSMALKTWISK